MTKLVKAEEPKAHKLRVDEIVTGDSYHSGEQFGDWWEDKDVSVRGLLLCKKDSYWDVIADWDVKLGEDVWLVYVQYGSGDSFGHSRGNVEYVGVWKTAEKAYKVAEQIRKNDNNKEDGLKYETESGKVIDESFTSWNGYFEHIEDIIVTCLKVGKEV